MTRPDFLAQLETALQQTARPFERATVLAFVADCWPLSEEDPDAERWTGEFLDAHAPAIAE
jgi:hypothetical protein